MKKGKGAKDYLKEPYVRILTPDEDTGTFTAEILEFPGCIAQGNTPQEAYRRLEKTAKGWIEASIDLGQEIPPPLSSHEFGGKFLLRLPKSVHRQVALAAERDGTSLNQFIVSALSEKVGAANLYDRLLAKIERCSFQIVANAMAGWFTMTASSQTGQVGRGENITLKEVTAYAGNENTCVLAQGSSRGSYTLQ